jgi:hypothetical protein
MNKILLYILIVISPALFAQAPQSFNYQGMLRDQTGAPVSTVSAIGVKFIITDGSSNVVHLETQLGVPVSTLGLFSTKIGLSPALSNTITWQNSPYNLAVSIDMGTGFVPLGSQQLVSVPFALYAQKAGNSLPLGTKNAQTLRWDGTANSWAIDSNITNDGSHVGIGLYPGGLRSRLHVITNSFSDTSAIFGYHLGAPPKGAGVRGLVFGNTTSNPNPFATAIYGGNHSAVNIGSGFAIGNLGVGASTNGTGAGLAGIGYANAPSATGIGLYATSVGPPGAQKFAAVFDQGNVAFNDSIFIVGTNTVGSAPGNVLTLSSTGRARWQPVPGGISAITTTGPILGGPILTGTGNISLAPSGVTPSTYGNPTNFPFFTVDTYGRITNAGTFPISAGVTTVNTAAPLTGGPITNSGTISLLPSGVTTGSYGASPITVPTFSVDNFGRIVSASSYTLSIPSNTLNGDVKGTFLSNTVTALQGFSVAAITPTLGQVLMLMPGSVWTPTTPPAIPAASWIKAATSVTLATISDNVGIGTASPAEKLQVESGGPTRLSVIASNTSAIWFGTTGFHNLGFIQYDNVSNEMNFGTNNTASRFRLFGNGTAAYGSTLAANPIGSHFNFCRQGANDTKVSITGGDNTNTYGAILALCENESGTQGFAFRMDAGANKLYITNDVNGTSNVMGIGGYAGQNLGVSIGPAYAPAQSPVNGLAVQGNVGIGTNVPSTALHVVGQMTQVDGQQGTGKVLVSDAAGIATWKSSPNAAIFTGLNNTTVNITTTPTQLGTGVITYNKIHGNTQLEITLESRGYNGTFGGGGAYISYQLRVDGNPIVSTTYVSTNNNTTEYITIKGYAAGLTAGSHNIQVYAFMDAGTSTGVTMDPGGFNGSILVKEQF